MQCKFATEFHHVVGDTLQMFKVKGQGHGVKGVIQGHGIKYQQQRRYNTAADRFSDFKLGRAL